jgi:hypothetical protein
LAQSGHKLVHSTCPLSGVKETQQIFFTTLLAASPE